MSKEALNKIMKELKTLTSDERRELIDRLTHEEQNRHKQIVRKPGTLKGTVKYMAPDFDAPLSSATHAGETTANGTTLRKWLNEATDMRAELSLTSDPVEHIERTPRGSLNEMKSTEAGR